MCRQRHKQGERERAGQYDSDKGKKSAKKELARGMPSDRYLSWSVGVAKRFKRAAMKPEGLSAGYSRSK